MKEGQPDKPAKIPMLGGACVALAAAGITAKATHDVAVSTNFITDPTFAWLAPLGIEGGSVAFAWLVWDASTRGESAKLKRFGLAFFLAMSMAANVYHVKDKGHFALLEAVFFPLALVLIVEALFGTKRTQERKRRQAAPASKPAKPIASAPPPRAAVSKPVPTTNREVVAATPTASVPKTSSPGSKFALVAALYAEDPTITGAEAARRLEGAVSVRTCQQALRKLKEEAEVEAA